MKYVKWAAIAAATVIALPGWIFMVALAVSYPVTAARIGHSPNDQCLCVYPSFFGGWKSWATVPRDGTRIEVLHAGSIPPWHGEYRWTDMMPWSMDIDTKRISYEKMRKPEWVKVGELRMSLSEGSDCLFWRYPR